jgi:hypothetical protein
MDLDASFLSFASLSFLPLISGLKVAGSALTTNTLKEIQKISTIQKLYLGYDNAEQVRPKDYALLRKLKNLRDLALVNLRSLPPELDLGHFVNLNGLEISGTQANLRIIGLDKLVNLKRLILMRQADPTLVPLSDIGCLTNLEYLHLFGITQQSDFEFDHMGLARMKNLKTLKIVATRC